MNRLMAHGAVLIILAAAALAGCSSMSWGEAGGSGAQIAAASPGMSLDGNGYIRHWLVLGPIRFGENFVPDEIEEEQIAGEARLMPREGGKQKVQTLEIQGTVMVEKELTWQRHDTEDYYFDLNAAFKMDDSTGCGGYAVAYLDAPAEMKGVTFGLCSNDSGKVFLNGEEIYTFVGDRSTVEDAELVKDLTLKKGINVIVFKVWNSSNNWQGNIRMLSGDGKPVTGVMVKVPK